MIYSTLQTYKKTKEMYPLSLQMALEFLNDNPILELQPGVYPIKGNQIYAQVVHTQTRPVQEIYPETHARFIDIHYAVKGEEQIGFAPVTNPNSVWLDSLAEKDLLQYRFVENESFVQMGGGSFAVFFPWDIHRPCCAVSEPGKLIKVVLKINMNTLDGTVS
ncbi:MAG: hypothetical protein K0R57_765 [Paenibacillaceae bacterium]|jgi:YhcH/YjgK/YiaL family protein|nr:hypothetical protein [Paenibacillaceae bacterium]